MEATLDQAALPAPAPEQDQRDPAAFIGNSSRDRGARDMDIDAGEAIRAPGYTPAVTSRISVQKVCSVVRKFDKFKRNLVEDIGFGGMLKIQMLAKLNLKFSAWLIERVESGKLQIDEERILPIHDHDVEKVLGLPRGTRWICYNTPEPSEACLEFLRASSSLSKGAHSLKAAEAYLLRDDINEDSSKVQIDCFKIAFVVFVVGHLLAPSTKYDYITIDFWAALNDTSRIKEFNWCHYVLEHLIRAVQKLKSGIRKRCRALHPVGCHIFLQVFYLDNLDLGPLSKTQDLPRISIFDHESIKKMTDIISTGVGGDTSFAGANFRCAQDVCCSRVQHESRTEEPFTLETNRAESRTEEPFTLETNRAESRTEEPFTLETNRAESRTEDPFTLQTNGADIASALPCHSPGFVGREDQHIPINLFDLDNLDLSPLSVTLEDLQSIGLFDRESIKKMPDVITNDVGGGTSFAGANLRHAQDVCYSRVQYESHTEEPFTPETNRADIASDLPRHTPGFGGTKDQHSPINPTLRSSFTETGQEDFSNQFRLKYPSFVGHPLATILEEHNARIMEIISEMSDSYQVSMLTFVEKLLGSLSENRCCCKALGRTDCLLRSPHAIHGNAHHTSPKRKSRFYSTESGPHKKTRVNPTS